MNKPRLSLSKFLTNLKKQGCKWVAMDEEGSWSAFYGKPTLRDGYWYSKEAMGEQEPLDSSLFEFSGSWKDSLIELTELNSNV